MDLYQEILCEVFKHSAIRVTHPDLKMDATEIVELVSYRMLERISEIIRDDTLEDEDCYQKIEEIICTFESFGSGGGGRHDFV